MSTNGMKKNRVFTLRTSRSKFNAVLAAAASSAVIGIGFGAYFYYNATYSPGWHTKDEGTYYIVQSTKERAVGLKLISNSSYLFDEDGYILTGWQEYNGNTYYFDQSGVMQKGIIKIDGEESVSYTHLTLPTIA